MTVQFHPSVSDTCYAGSLGFGPAGEGLHRSHDRGETWIDVGSACWVITLAINPLNTQRMYRTYDNGLYRTGDGGETWRLKMDGMYFTIGDEAMEYVVLNPALPETVYAGKSSMFATAEIYRSFDHAQSWHEMLIPGLAYYSCAFAVDPQDGRTLWAVADNAIVVSENYGDAGTWASVLDLAGVGSPRCVAIDPNDGNRVYVGYDSWPGGGIYMTSDGGNTWKPIGAAEGLAAKWVTTIEVDPANSMNVYAGTGYNDATDVYLSTTGGLSWLPFDAGMPDTTWVFDLAVDPEAGEVVLAATSHGIYRYSCTTAAEDSEFPRSAFALEQNRPNPFNPNTSLEFSVASECRVTLGIYDCCGRLVRVLVDGVMPPGTHHAVWDGVSGSGTPAASGVYFCRLDAGGSGIVKKMVLMK